MYAKLFIKLQKHLANLQNRTQLSYFLKVCMQSQTKDLHQIAEEYPQKYGSRDNLNDKVKTLARKLKWQPAKLLFNSALHKSTK